MLDMEKIRGAGLDPEDDYDRERDRRWVELPLRGADMPSRRNGGRAYGRWRKCVKPGSPPDLMFRAMEEKRKQKMDEREDNNG